MGCGLVLHGRSEDKLAALREGLEIPVHTMAFDMTDARAIEAGVAAIPTAFADIDLLVNNAGGALGLEKAYEADLADWDAMIDTNVRALARMTRLVLPGMVARKRGHIVNIGSVAGNWPYPGGHVYCAVKAFVKQFSLAIRADLAGTNVRVTNIEPGMAQTQFSAVRFKGDTEKAKAVYANTTPLTPEDIAEAAAWCATLPPHVNINSLEIMPTTQSFGPLAVERF
jgi:3-hydroxy acid dehydrogenase/malonic semialdehyde reductase